MESEKGKKEFTLYGMRWPLFFGFSAVVFVTMWLGVLPDNMAGVIPLLIARGVLLAALGDRLPIIKSFFGGGPITIIFGCAALVMLGIIPQETVAAVDGFMQANGFLDVVVCTLIAGSIMGMDRRLLAKAAVRYLPCVIFAQILGIVAAGLYGFLSGYGVSTSILYVALPCMGGGLGAGAIPLSEMFAGMLGVPSSEVLTKMLPSISIGNAFAICCAGLLDKLGKVRPAMTGNGCLMPLGQENGLEAKDNRPKSSSDYQLLGIGLAFSTAFFCVGQLVALVIPVFHAYAYTIIFIAILKGTGIVPKVVEDACFLWYQAFMKNCQKVILAGVGIVLLDLNELISVFTLNYFLLIATIILATTLGAMFAGKLVGFYPIEAGMSVGLCSVNMGGSGDLMVLSSGKRMELLPFSSISTRIGGALILLSSSFIFKLVVSLFGPA